MSRTIRFILGCWSVCAFYAPATTCRAATGEQSGYLFFVNGWKSISNDNAEIGMLLAIVDEEPLIIDALRLIPIEGVWLYVSEYGIRIDDGGGLNVDLRVNRKIGIERSTLFYHTQPVSDRLKLNLDLETLAEMVPDEHQTGEKDYNVWFTVFAHRLCDWSGDREVVRGEEIRLKTHGIVVRVDWDRERMELKDIQGPNVMPDK